MAAAPREFEPTQVLHEQWLAADQNERHSLQLPELNWTLGEKALVASLRKPFDVLARGLVGAMGGSGEGKVTPSELFADGVFCLDPHTAALIRAA